MSPLDNLSLKILVGPIYDPKLLGRHLYNANIHCFAYDWDSYTITEPVQWHPNNFDSLIQNEPTALKHWIQRYVYDWQADLLVWFAPVHQPIPIEIANLKIPKVAIAHDWHLNGAAIEFCKINFDWLFVDRRLEKALKDTPNKSYWTCYGVEVSPGSPPLLKDRKHDICFIGSISHHHIPERTHYIQRLLMLSSKFKVKCLSGVYGENYMNVLRQSKIVCNFTQRNEMNLRAYEAAAAGALLFIEDSNLEVSDILPPNQASVFFNTINFEQQIAFYLANISHAQNIASQGYQNILCHQYEHQFEKLILNILQNPSLRSPKELSSFPKHHSITYIRHILLSRSPHKHKDALAAITYLKTKAPNLSPALIHAEIVTQTHELLISTDIKLWNQTLPASIQKKLKTWTQTLIDLDLIDHPAVLFNLGMLFLLLEQADVAKNSFQKALTLLPQKKWSRKDLYFQFLLPLYTATVPTSMLHHHLELTWFEGDFNAILQELFPWAIYHTLADFFFIKQNHPAAQYYYSKALYIKEDVSWTWLNLSQSYTFKEIDQIAYCLDKYLQYSPIDRGAWLTIMRLFKKAGHNELAQVTYQKLRWVTETTQEHPEKELRDLDMVEILGLST